MREGGEVESVMRGAERSATRAGQGQAGADAQGERAPPQALSFFFVTRPLPDAAQPNVCAWVVAV